MFCCCDCQPEGRGDFFLCKVLHGIAQPVPSEERDLVLCSMTYYYKCIHNSELLESKGAYTYPSVFYIFGQVIFHCTEFKYFLKNTIMKVIKITSVGRTIR